jgi:hypothetical protein
LQAAVRFARHQVGEGAAAINPELPLFVAAHVSFPARPCCGDCFTYRLVLHLRITVSGLKLV